MKLDVKIAWLALAALFSTGAAARADDVGVLAIVQNEVRLQVPGQERARPVRPMQSLPANSRVTVGAGGRAVVVLYRNGSRFALPAGSTAVVTAGQVQGVSGPAPARLAPLNLQQAGVLRGSRVAFGRSASVTSRNELEKLTLEPLALSAGATLENRPTFRWTAVPGAVSYKITLYDEEDRTILLREVTGTSLAYPQDAPALKTGVDYLWRVTTQLPNEKLEADGAFRVLTPEQAAAVQAEIAGLTHGSEPDAETELFNEVLKAEVYFNADLLDDAIAVYRQLLQKHPDSAVLHQSLSVLLADARRPRASEEHRKRATDLAAR